MKIREIRSKDIEDVESLMREFARFDGSEEELHQNTQVLKEAYFGSDPKLSALVIADGEKVVGFLHYYRTFSSFELKSTLWVEDAFISEAYRRKGLGNELFQTLRNLAKSKDCIRIEWLVRKNNRSGIKFYEDLGAHVDEGTIYVKWKVK